MKALIRGTEVYKESDWTPYTKANLAWYIGQEKDEDGNPIKGDGWTLIEDYQEPAEEEQPEET